MALTFGGIKVDGNVAGDFNEFQRKILHCLELVSYHDPWKYKCPIFFLPLNAGEGKFRPALTGFHPSNGTGVTEIPPFH